MMVPAASDVIAALAVPADARVDQRVPKKLFLEQGAPTAADKRVLQEGIEEVTWIAALKPENVAVPLFRDDAREYVEIAVLSVTLRSDAKATRLIELIHRAIHYPLVLVTEQAGVVAISLSHKRASLGEAGKIVLDRPVLAVTLSSDAADGAFLASLPLASRSSENLYAVYQGWVECVHTLMASRLTGRYTLPQTPQQAAARQGALDDYVHLLREIAGLRAKAAKETQINRRVELNLALQRLEAQVAAATKNL